MTSGGHADAAVTVVVVRASMPCLSPWNTTQCIVLQHATAAALATISTAKAVKLVLATAVALAKRARTCLTAVTRILPALNALQALLHPAPAHGAAQLARRVFSQPADAAASAQPVHLAVLQAPLKLSSAHCVLWESMGRAWAPLNVCRAARGTQMSRG